MSNTDPAEQAAARSLFQSNKRAAYERAAKKDPSTGIPKEVAARFRAGAAVVVNDPRTGRARAVTTPAEYLHVLGHNHTEGTNR